MNINGGSWHGGDKLAECPALSFLVSPYMQIHIRHHYIAHLLPPWRQSMKLICIKQGNWTDKVYLFGNWLLAPLNPYWRSPCIIYVYWRGNEIINNGFFNGMKLLSTVMLHLPISIYLMQFILCGFIFSQLLLHCYAYSCSNTFTRIHSS